LRKISNDLTYFSKDKNQTEIKAHACTATGQQFV
jgi:hypothetical protein